MGTDTNKTGLDIQDKDVTVLDSDSQLKSPADESEIEGDDIISNRARREAAREHSDTYLVKSDLEDDDQRSASPG